MGEWKPTIGTWNDEENYNMQEPTWRKMLKAISEYDEAGDVKKILVRLGEWNLTSYDIWTYVVGYVMNQKDVDLRKYVSVPLISKIQKLSAKSDNIEDYTRLVLKECHVSEAVIEEIDFNL